MSKKKQKVPSPVAPHEGPPKVINPAKGIERALVITAHPDDVDFGAAGTVAVLSKAGVNVTYCIVTDGDAGGSDLGTTREQRAALRRREQTTAAEQVGVSDLIFLGYEDGKLEANLALRKDISRVIRQVRPDRVICQSPTMNLDRIYASHPDHLAAGSATISAVYPDARNPFAFPDLLEKGFEPHAVPEVWVMADPNPTMTVDTTGVIDQKIAALRSHDSQVGDGEHIEELLTTWGRQTAKMAGLKKKRTAEAFRVVNTQ